MKMCCNSKPQEHPDGRVDYQYAAKIVCGVVKPIPPTVKDHNSLPIGEYFTKVNIHNPSRCNCVTFQWKVAIGYPSLKVGPISEFMEVTLCPDEALEIDCDDIYKRFKKKLGHIEGWVVIETPAQLDVVAVYGTTHATGGAVNDFHTERVPFRCLPACDDFNLNISTGISAWEVKNPGQPDSSYTLATLGSASNAWSNIPGALWVHPVTNGAGIYTYRLEFDFCYGYKNPILNMELLADNRITNISLNGNTIPVTLPNSSHFNITPIVCLTSQFFKPGTNVLTITVDNFSESPTGLLVHGFIEAENALCHDKPYPLLPCPSICYRAYTRKWIISTQDKNGFWGDWVCNGQTAGTTGQNRRVEAVEIMLSNAPPGTTITYRVYQQNNGWLPWVGNGQTAGQAGFPPLSALRLEAIEILLVNSLCQISYRVHTANKWGSGGGWQPWVNNGQTAGTTGQNRRMEALEVVIQ